MSFKNFSVSQDTPSEGKPDDETKTAPAVDEPGPQPDKKQDEVAPAQKP